MIQEYGDSSINVSSENNVKVLIGKINQELAECLASKEDGKKILDKIKEIYSRLPSNLRFVISGTLSDPDSELQNNLKLVLEKTDLLSGLNFQIVIQSPLTDKSRQFTSAVESRQERQAIKSITKTYDYNLQTDKRSQQPSWILSIRPSGVFVGENTYLIPDSVITSILVSDDKSLPLSPELFNDEIVNIEEWM
ncbi:hypothetical protein GYA19_03510 [Candidatus Beckwithbacteria bacterium]|nr:hypothetical protein [Candidatus Beckwithbacteria bacterium]